MRPPFAMALELVKKSCASDPVRQALVPSALPTSANQAAVRRTILPALIAECAPALNRLIFSHFLKYFRGLATAICQPAVAQKLPLTVTLAARGPAFTSNAKRRGER